nr:MAG TPA: hypothetical protein [Caudoviricetes sp.]
MKLCAGSIPAHPLTQVHSHHRKGSTYEDEDQPHQARQPVEAGRPTPPSRRFAEGLRPGHRGHQRPAVALGRGLAHLGGRRARTALDHPEPDPRARAGGLMSHVARVARTTRELNTLSDEELADLQEELREALFQFEVEARRVSNLRHDRLLGLRKRRT